ncbi:MAG: SDR family oxidoreductase [Psychromonas sp.]|nr:SDR family oxidoreductase [Psychromonas sp.]
MNIYLTGTTGFLGKRFLKEILKDSTVTAYIAIRPKRGQDTAQRLIQLGLFNDPRVIPVEQYINDSTEELALPEEIDEFWHIAGLTDFHESKRKQLYKVNVGGTEQALELAKKMKAKRYFHVSTAYVAGIYDDIVKEDALLECPEFRNPYEETKYKSEQLVRSSGLPFIIIRPSIIMGDSKTGEVDVDKMVYGFVKTYHLIYRLVKREYRDKECIPNDLKYFVKGNHLAEKNLICVDDVVHLMSEIQKKGEIGKTYHCVNPQTTTIGKLHKIAIDLLNVKFLEMQISFLPLLDRKQKIIDSGVDVYADYMMYSDPIFDLKNITKINSQPIVPMNNTVLNFLFDTYLQTQQSNSGNNKTSTLLDLSRLPDVKQYGCFPLAYETMSRQLQVFRLDNSSGYIGYAIVDATAIMVGDPVSNIDQKLLNGFIAWCLKSNLNFCAVQISERVAKICRKIGLTVNKLGIETSLYLDEVDILFKGKAYQNLRNYKNIARRSGLMIREGKIGPDNINVISNISSQWLKGKKNHSELSIFLREISLETEPCVRYFFAELDGKIVGYIFFNPIFKKNSIIGYYANIERYDLQGHSLPSRFNLTTHIIYEAILKFKIEGLKYLSLGLSPLYDVMNSPFNDSPELTGLFCQLFEESELYAFKGVAFNKAMNPNKKEGSVFLAVTKDTLSEDIMTIFKGIGLFEA